MSKSKKGNQECIILPFLTWKEDACFAKWMKGGNKAHMHVVSEYKIVGVEFAVY